MSLEEILNEVDRQIALYIEQTNQVPNAVLMTWAEFCDLQNGYAEPYVKHLNYKLTVIVAPYISKLSVGRLLVDN